MTVTEQIITDQPKIDRLLLAYLTGHDTKEAAALAGISRRRVDEWRSQGEQEPDGVYGEIAAQIDACIAEWIDQSMVAINASRAKDWKAALALLQASPHTRDRYAARLPDSNADMAAAALTLLASRLPPPPPAASLPPASATAIEVEVRELENARAVLPAHAREEDADVR